MLHQSLKSSMKYLYKFCFAIVCLLSFSDNLSAQNKLPQLLIRLDDIGMNHSVNMAMEQVAKTKMPFSASVQFACPWYQEAVAILKKNPQVSVGVHLTLTSEWRYYRWGPVLGKEAVPSLVDGVGYFRQSTGDFARGGYKMDDVERELSAQIERAQASGLKITYIDPHMGVALSTPAMRALTEKLAHKYKLAISPLSTVSYFGETYLEMWGEPVATKKKAFLAYVSSKLNPIRPNLVVIHVAQMCPEMDALFDMNASMMNNKEGKPLTSYHSQTELNMLLSPEFKVMQGKNFQAINYEQMLKGKDISVLNAVDGE